MLLARKALALVLTLTAGNGYALSLPDPTRPADAPVAGTGAGPIAPAGPTLQSTLVSPSRRSAVIDGRTVAVGDKVRGAMVIDIQPYEVRLKQNGRETSLRLMPKLAREKGGTQ